MAEVPGRASDRSRSKSEDYGSTSLEFGCDSDQPVCTPCERHKKEVSSRSYCVQCKEYLCVRCARHHRDHVKLTGDTMPGITSVRSDPKDESDICANHNLVKHKHCVDHDCLCCDKCVQDQHKNCQLKNLDEVTAEVDIGALKRKVLDSVQRQMEAVKEKKTGWTNRKDFIKQEKLRQTEEVKRLCNDVIVEVQNLEKNCIEDISRLLASEISRADNVIQHCNHYLKRIRDDIRLAAEPRIESKETKIVNLTSIQDRVQTKYQGFIDDSQADAGVYKTTLRKSLHDKVNIQRIKSFHSLICGSRQDGSSSQKLLSCTFMKPSVMLIAKHSVTIGGDGPVSSDQTCITAVEALGDERIIVADEGNQRLKIFDTEFRHVFSIGVSSAPRGLSVYQEKICAITLPEEGCVQLFDIHNDKLIEKRRVNVNSECTDVALISKGMIVCRFGCESDPFLQYDNNGKLMRKFRFPAGVGKRPNYICVNNDESILYISDATEGIFTVNIKQEAIGVWQYRHADLKCPLGIAVDSNDMVYTVDYESGMILRLNVGGHFSNTRVGEATIVLGHPRPQCICYLPSKKELLVALDGSYYVLRLRVYDALSTLRKRTDTV